MKDIERELEQYKPRISLCDLALSEVGYLMWSLEELAELFRVGKQRIRFWIVTQRLVEFRLHRVGAWKVKPVLTTDQVLRLLDIKRPTFGSGSEEERLFNIEREAKSRAGLAASAARMARLQVEAKKIKERD